MLEQDGSVSVWKRVDGHLTYSLAGLHKLVPPPSRVTNNATVNLLCLAASPWQRCLADAPRDTIMHSLASARPSRCVLSRYLGCHPCLHGTMG